MLNVNDISFAYDKGLVLEDVGFQLGKGQHLAVMGESGCGKSTLLKLIYGILEPSKGKLSWGDEELTGPSQNLVPGKKFMKYLAQEFDLMPYITVEENIAEFLSVFYPEERKERTRDLLMLIELEDFAKVKVQHLSGGQRQRVAIARVLAQKPELLLLDEPFSHIDNFRKNSLRRNLYGYLRAEGISCLTATHDHNDVLPFADRIIVIKDRHIIADSPILQLYQNPREIYVASLFGEANKIPVNIVKSYADTQRRIIVYAHEFKISYTSGLAVRVLNSYPMGSHYLIRGQTNEGQEIFFHAPAALEKDKEVFLNVSIETLNKRLQLPDGS